MRVLSSSTGGEWLETPAPADDGRDHEDPAELEAERVLSDAFRCTNLVVLAGLGTSLSVTRTDGTRPAPTMAALWHTVRGTYELLGDWPELLALVRFRGAEGNLEQLLSQCRLAESFMTGGDLATVTQFIEMAEREIHRAVNFVGDDLSMHAHLEFLRRVGRRSSRKARAKLFTTNYDLCFEEAARRSRFVFIDGFTGSSPPTFDSIGFTYDVVVRDKENGLNEFIPNVLHFYKLHGSIDWERNDTFGEVRRVPGTSRPLLIYPRYSKFELAFQQPYLEMMGALQSALREPDTGLIVVGFGFNDDHISEPILAAIRSNLGLKVVVVSPSLAGRDDGGRRERGDAETNAHLRQIVSLIAAGDARLALLASTFGTMVPLLPDIAAETDMERHVERLRKLGQPV